MPTQSRGKALVWRHTVNSGCASKHHPTSEIPHPVWGSSERCLQGGSPDNIGSHSWTLINDGNQQRYVMTCLLQGLLFCMLLMQLKPMNHCFFYLSGQRVIRPENMLPALFQVLGLHRVLPYVEVLPSCHSWSITACPSTPHDFQGFLRTSKGFLLSVKPRRKEVLAVQLPSQWLRGAEVLGSGTPRPAWCILEPIRQGHLLERSKIMVWGWGWVKEIPCVLNLARHHFALWLWPSNLQHRSLKMPFLIAVALKRHGSGIRNHLSEALY